MTLQTGCKHNHSWFNWLAHTHHTQARTRLHNINKVINSLLLYNQNKANQMHLDARQGSKAGRNLEGDRSSGKNHHL